MNQQTRAETQAAAPFPIDIQQNTGVIGGIVSVLAAMVWGILALRRRVSRDNAEVAKDRVESDLFRTLQADNEQSRRDRDAAREAERKALAEKQVLAVENASLKAHNEHLHAEIAKLNNTLAELQRQFDEVKRRLQQLAHGATGHSGHGDL